MIARLCYRHETVWITIMNANDITSHEYYENHYDLVTSCGHTQQGRHWLRQWHIARRHQVITRMNIDLSSLTSSDNHVREILPDTSVMHYKYKLE